MFYRQKPPPQGPGAQNSTFSKHGHVVYRIKGNNECSNMVANILHADPHHPHPKTWDVGSKCQNSTFSEHSLVNYQIKGNEA